MKIGVGVTTYNRSLHKSLWLNQYALNTGDCKLCIAEDSNQRKGIAYRKNQCLSALKDCDYIFLFDDDCFPIKEGWVEFFINAHKASSQYHFIYLCETSTIKKMTEQDGIYSYNNCGGCMMFLTKEVIEKVGGFNKEYGWYGFEHAGYSERIHKAELTPMGKYLCPSSASDYIYSMDYQNHLPFNKQVNHKSSVNIFEAQEEIKDNKKIFLQDIQTIYQPL